MILFVTGFDDIDYLRAWLFYTFYPRDPTVRKLTKKITYLNLMFILTQFINLNCLDFSFVGNLNFKLIAIKYYLGFKLNNSN